MYAIHTTPGFIIESRPCGEAGKLLSIFTRELGLVMASAQGIRLEKSKLRYHAQELSFGEFSFVRGKEFWRLTNATSLEVADGKHRSTDMSARAAVILKMLLHGEEPHPELFDQVRRSLELFSEISSSMPVGGSAGEGEIGDIRERLSAVESLAVFRIVKLLGYVGNDAALPSELINAPMDIGIVETAMLHRESLNRHINKALRESQL